MAASQTKREVKLYLGDARPGSGEGKLSHLTVIFHKRLSRGEEIGDPAPARFHVRAGRESNLIRRLPVIYKRDFLRYGLRQVLKLKVHV